ncbi:uncharacterized protein LOC129269968 [Lytechinus pictus]|uniref:uncharacterized protein LOC129269968 n=1 Tax=Lytechinus pictus TaxID=7653 RepID=UPI0030B9CA5F
MQIFYQHVQGRIIRNVLFVVFFLLSLLSIETWYLHVNSITFMKTGGCAKHDVTKCFNSELFRSSLEDVYRIEDHMSNGTTREKEGISVFVISFPDATLVDGLRIVHHYTQNITVYKPREYLKDESPCFVDRFHFPAGKSSLQDLDKLKSHLVALNTTFNSFQLQYGSTARREVTNLSDVVGTYAINLCSEVPSYWLT